MTDEVVGRSQQDLRRLDGLMSRELGSLTKDLIEDALAWCRGRKQASCALLGCNRVFFWKFLRRYDIDADAIARAAEDGTWVYRTSPAGAPWVVPDQGE